MVQTPAESRATTIKSGFGEWKLFLRDAARSWNRLSARDTVLGIVRALVVALALLVVVPGIRAAAPPKDVATAHVRKATAAYNLGKYADAAKEYEAAYEQTLDPNLLFNIAQAYRLAGDREKAITAYRSFIRSAPQSE